MPSSPPRLLPSIDGLDTLESNNYYTRLTNSDYRLSYDGTDYTLTRLSDNTSWSNNDLGASEATTVRNSEGFSLSLASGTIATGNTFLIKPTSEVARNLKLNPTVAGDARLINAAMPFKTSAATSNGGNGKISAGRQSTALPPLTSRPPASASPTMVPAVT